MFSKAAIQAYRDWQDALARYGVTEFAADLFWQLARQLEIYPMLEPERLRLRWSGCTIRRSKILGRDHRD